MKEEVLGHEGCCAGGGMVTFVALIVEQSLSYQDKRKQRGS